MISTKLRIDELLNYKKPIIINYSITPFMVLKEFLNV